MSIIYISDTCFQISTLSLIKSVRSIEKVWEERKRSRRGNCKWENYWPHSRSSRHHRQNPETAPPGPEAFWHIEVTVGRRWRNCTDCSLWYREVEKFPLSQGPCHCLLPKNDFKIKWPSCNSPPYPSPSSADRKWMTQLPRQENI